MAVAEDLGRRGGGKDKVGWEKKTIKKNNCGPRVYHARSLSLDETIVFRDKMVACVGFKSNFLLAPRTMYGRDD